MPSQIARVIVSVYRLIVSPMIHLMAGPGMGCKFTPTCSQYTLDAIEIHGCGRGLLLSLKRISRCHPFSPASDDPVPHVIGKPQINFKPE